MKTKEQILTAAARLFHNNGYNATGVSAILAQAGVNAGSLYHYFSGKEDLLKGVLEHYENMLYPQVMQPLEQTEPDPVERIFRLLDWYRGYLQEQGCRMGCPVGNLVLELSDTHPELRPYLQRNFDKWQSLTAVWLDEAGSSLPADIDRQELAGFVLTVMQGAVMQARSAASLEPFDQSVRQLRAYFDALQQSTKQTEPERVQAA